MGYEEKLSGMQQFYNSGATRSYEFRKQQLTAFKKSVENNEEEIYKALYKDLKKSMEESWITENGFVLSDLKNALKHLKKWMKPKRVGTNLVNFPGSSHIYSEPLGLVLIIAPWNYPVNLLFTPLIGAIAAGNCVVLKSSEFAPASSAIMKKIVEETFDEKFVMFVEGEGAVVVPELMSALRFDHIFYTGSTAVGKKIYQAAAKDLIPVTLELGGKSPCIVESDADVKAAARRICFAKFTNSGQTCVAPDYVLAHDNIIEKLKVEMIKAIEDFFGKNTAESYDYGRIINGEQWHRLRQYVEDGEVLYGGKYEENNLFIEPTLLTNVSLQDKVMQEEIFGPVLPIFSFTKMEEAMAIIAPHKNPLALYLFTSDSQKEAKWLEAVPFGGGCVNNASVHLINEKLPFGGRGNSGIGHYHGRFSFDTFSHKKSVLKSGTWLDPDLKYPPYKGKLGLLKKMIG